MAPTTRVKTYERKKNVLSLSKTKDMFKSKRRKKPLQIKELPKTTYNAFSGDSFRMPEDSFDRLANGPIFNPVRFQKNLDKVYCTSDSDLSRSKSILKEITNSIHSPVVRARKKRLPRIQTLKVEDTKKETSRDKPIEDSLEVEIVKMNLSPPNFRSLSFINLTEIVEEAKFNGLNYSNVFKKDEVVSSTPTVDQVVGNRLLRSRTKPLGNLRKNLLLDSWATNGNLKDLEESLRKQEDLIVPAISISSIDNCKTESKEVLQDWSSLITKSDSTGRNSEELVSKIDDQTDNHNSLIILRCDKTGKSKEHNKSVVEDIIEVSSPKNTIENNWSPKLFSSPEIASFNQGNLLPIVEEDEASRPSLEQENQLVVNITNIPVVLQEDETSCVSSEDSISLPKQDLIINLTNLPVEQNHKIQKDHELIINLTNHPIEQDDDVFVKPSLPSNKEPQLKPGKLWRRSLCDLRRSEQPNNRRQSIRIVPTKSLSRRRNTSILESFALRTSYASHEEDIDVNLENGLRSLSLKKRKKRTFGVPSLSLPLVTAREIVLKRCGQTEPLPFEECYPKSSLQNCQKIGEGVYGEVFLYKNPHGGTTVMKVIPIEGDQIVNGERQKKYEEILSEIIISMELSNLRNSKKNITSCFTEVQNVQCVQGCYPERLLELWELYDETRHSENDSPEVFTADQLYIVLELANGGSDLEAFVFNNALQTFSMFQQVACALAVAEAELHFEHRDLHWGNVLITMAKTKKLHYLIEGDTVEINTQGVTATIIDFTLSRIEFDGVVIFNDLGLDADLFTAKGDYQFDIYRLMQAKNGNNWKHFEPFTNILWLHYILDKALVGLRYKNAKSKIHKEYLDKLNEFKDSILNYASVKDFILNNFV